MTQSNGWQSQSLKDSHAANRKRNKQVAQLRASRVAGTEHTPDELVAIHAQLKADYLAREAQRRTVS